MKFFALVCAALAIIGIAADARAALRSAVKKSAMIWSSHLDLSKRQVSTECSTACSGAGDAAAAAGLQNCARTDLICICTYLAQISGNCIVCVAGSEGITLGELQSGCAAATMSAPTDSVMITDDVTQTSSRTPTSTSSSAAPITTGGMCEAQCSSAADVAAATDLAACDEDDAECICQRSRYLTPGCLACSLQQEDTSDSDYEAVCAATSSSASTTGTNTGIVPPISLTMSTVTCATGLIRSSSCGLTGSSTVPSPSPSTTLRGAAVRCVAPSCFLGLLAVIVGVVMV